MSRLLGICVLLLSLAFAPAPMKTARPDRSPRNVLGEWTCVWGSMTYTANLTPEGRWFCWNETSRWRGYWKVEGDVLTIREGIEDSAPTFTWQATYQSPTRWLQQGNTARFGIVRD